MEPDNKIFSRFVIWLFIADIERFGGIVICLSLVTLVLEVELGLLLILKV